MKPVRVLLISLGVIVSAGAIMAGLALTPAVQRWAVLRAARDVPGLRLELAAVRAGFSGLTLDGVRAQPHGVPVRVDRLEADFSLIDLVLGRKLDLGRLVVRGLNVDVSHLPPAAPTAVAAGAPAAGPGLLGQIRLPFDLSLDNVSIMGRALLPGAAGQSPIEAEYTITGGGFAPGREGLLSLDATLRNAAPAARVTTLQARAGLRASLGPQRTFTKVSLTTVVDAAGPALAGQTQLKIGAELYGTSRGENYEVAVSTLLQGVAENVLFVRALLPPGSRDYAGEWDFKVRTAQLEPFVLGGNLPEFDAAGGGRFAFDPGTGHSALQGQLQGRVNRLELVDPGWRALGALAVEADFDLNLQDGVLDLRRFKGSVAGASPVLDIQTTAPLRFDLGRRELLANGGFTADLLKVNLQGLPLEWVRPFITTADVSGGMLTGRLEVVRATTGGSDTTVRGQVSLDEINVVREGRFVLAKAALTANGEATLGPGGTVTAPVVELTVRTAGGDMLDLSGRLSAGPGRDAPLTLAARFNASTVTLLDRWLPGDPVILEGEIDLTRRGHLLEIQPGRLEIRQGSGRAVLNATVAQPFSFNLASHELRPRDATAPVARIALGRLPLALLPVTQPDTVLGGYLQQAEFELGAPDGNITVHALEPLRLAEVSLSQNRQKALTGLAIAVRPTLDYAGPGSLKLQSGEVTVHTADRSLLATLELEATQVPGQDAQVVMNFTLAVPSLASQPVFAGARSVSAGRASGEVRASLGAMSQIEARLTLNGLLAAGSEQTLPVANVGFRARIQPSGAASVQVPLLLDNGGRRSDLEFALDLSPLGRGYSVDGRLTGQQVELEDLLGVLGVFMAAAAPDSVDAPVPATNVAPDTAAAWSRFSGRLGLDVKSVTRGADWAMTGLTGAVAIEPSLVTLQRLEASFGETSRLAAKMELRFTGGAMPYRLTGDYALNDFDTGRLFKAIDPSRPPTIEGLFNISGRLGGNGETVTRAIDRVQGELQLTSRGGVFRGLQRASNKVSMTSKAVELGASVLGSIFGSDNFTKTAEKVAGQAYFVDQLAQGIGEFSYDLLSVRLSRDGLLNMNLEDISLVSPEIRLQGRGSVSYVIGRPLLEQPLTASLDFSARGKTEQLFAKARLLDGTKDDLGYSRTREPVTLGGTLAKPDPTAFFTRIASAKLADFLDTEN